MDCCALVAFIACGLTVGVAVAWINEKWRR